MHSATWINNGVLLDAATISVVDRGDMVKSFLYACAFDVCSSKQTPTALSHEVVRASRS